MLVNGCHSFTGVDHPRPGRLGAWTRTPDNPAVPHYFDSDPQARSRPGSVRLRLPDLEVTLATDAGVFGRASIDRGTLFLLRRGPAPPGSGNILDLGSGYGPVAVTMALRSPATTVYAVDVNRRALELTAANAAAAGAANLVAATPDEVPAGLRFSAIYSNPPIRVGLSTLHPMLVSWLDRLEPEGAAAMVVHRHLGSDSLARWLQHQGYGCERLASHDGYRILRVRPRGAVGDDR